MLFRSHWMVHQLESPRIVGVGANYYKKYEKLKSAIQCLIMEMVSSESGDDELERLGAKSGRLSENLRAFLDGHNESTRFWKRRLIELT